MNLTVLMVTNGEPHAHQFAHEALTLADSLGFEFVLGCDGTDADDLADTLGCDSISVYSNGSVESVLDQAVKACAPGYILRLDDDERCSQPMRDWLARRENWEVSDHWAFPRANLWPTARSVIATEPLWPDLQTRLSIREKAAGRRTVHAGSPFGTGTVAPVAIEHHKFLVRSYEQRAAILARYEKIQPGAGSDHYRAFSLPEHINDITLAGYDEVYA